MGYWTIPLILFGLFAVSLGARMLRDKGFTRGIVQAKWPSLIIILVGVACVVRGLYILLKSPF
jgi:hypothetical protein